MRALTLPRLALALVFVGIFAMAFRPSVDTDTWWHLRAGAWMVAHGQVLTHDAFSTTRLGQAWINHSWLSQIPMYLAWQALGYAGLNLFTAALVTAAFWFVYRQCEGSAYLKAFCLILAAAASAVFWSARPQLTSFLLVSIFACLVWEFRWRGRNRLWLLPPLMLLWVNLHGGFAIGFILLLVTLAGQVIDRLLHAGQPGVLGWRGLGALALATAGCLVVVPLNPYGFQLYLYPLRTVSIGVLQNFIQEWQSPNFHMLGAQVFVWLLLATLAAIGLSRRRMLFTDLALLGAFTYLALLAGRNIAMAALIAAPILTRHMAAWLSDLHAEHPRLAAVLDPTPSAGRWPVLNWALLGLALLAALLKVADASLPSTNEMALAAYLPMKAADFVQQAQPPGPMFNSYNWGGYLVWRLYPDYPVFVDGRTDLYDDALLTEYLDVAAGRSDYASVLAKYGIKLVFVEQDSLLADRLLGDPAWRQLYRDERAVVYERAAP
ncbi:MAG: hypothetical protein ABI847_08040 [Anaerolineales bacterium]